MGILYFLQSLRNPVTDAIFSLITYFGDEVLFIAVALLFLWCIDKEEGYYILTMGFAGTLLNQFLKITCRVPRPWVKDPNFTIVESAKEAASGYSFPSGHTQTSVTTYGGLALWNKKRWVRILCIAMCVLVPFSRLYLGVHTPLDVGVSIVIALALVFGLRPLFTRIKETPLIMYVMLGVLFLFSLGFVFYVNLYPFPENIDTHNYESAVKNAYLLLGALPGLAITYFMDNRVHRYEPKAPLLAQILKLALGLSLVLALKAVLKAPFRALLGGYAGDILRYFLLIVAAGGLWPFTFPYFTRFALWVKKKWAKEEK